eukprot:CAMPEP_0183723354 /NCGR_PEP_ID=MMETSP0737-20130205/14947_1 /TAXON_ID=385413 /ORGANISM="Thalassiosira miniscula, Strain CCMP1093" /LENGTH=239 /DNA_ID=CAMNT_0025953615 /DNA_START=97 /DNA_END=816 /DNA_ORIENTATION=-
MAGILKIPLALTSILIMGHSITVEGNSGKDLLPECAEWAERGDCKPSGRPYFMQKNCPESCYKKTHKEPEHRRIHDDDEEFYQLSAKDANGKVLSMDQFEGYITVLVNSARVCDYSEVFYESLEHMHSVHPYALEFLAFPFDHPNIDIEKCRETLESIEKKKGRKIHVMEAVKINGSDTHPVFKYLKKLFEMEELDPNVAHYFFVNPDGTLIEHHHGASYKTLKGFVDMYEKQFLGDEL